MKYFSVFLLILFCSFFPALQHLEKTNPTFTPRPFIFPQFGKEWKDVPQGECFTDTLYPIGWSRDGKFAYIMQATDPEDGAVAWNFVVFDVVNDTFPMDSYYSDPESGIRSMNEAFPRCHGSDTIKKMRDSWKIIPTNKFYFRTFPDKPEKKAPAVEYYIVRDSIKNPPYKSEFIRSASIFVVPLKKEKQILWQRDFAQPSRFTELEALGYFRSPYRDINVVFCGIAKAQGEFSYSRVKSLFPVAMNLEK